jgi:hypothetical protein
MKSSTELKFFYPLLLWIVTLVTGPIIWIFYQFINKGFIEGTGMLAIFFPLIVLSLFMSLPTLLGIIVAYIIITMRTKNVFNVKLSLWLITLFGITITLIDFESPKMFELGCSYSIAASIAILFISPRKKKGI